MSPYINVTLETQVIYLLLIQEERLFLIQVKFPYQKELLFCDHGLICRSIYKIYASNWQCIQKINDLPWAKKMKPPHGPYSKAIIHYFCAVIVLLMEKMHMWGGLMVQISRLLTSWGRMSNLLWYLWYNPQMLGSQEGDTLTNVLKDVFCLQLIMTSGKSPCYQPEANPYSPLQVYSL